MRQLKKSLSSPWELLIFFICISAWTLAQVYTINLSWFIFLSILVLMWRIVRFLVFCIYYQPIAIIFFSFLQNISAVGDDRPEEGRHCHVGNQWSLQCCCSGKHQGIIDLPSLIHLSLPLPFNPFFLSPHLSYPLHCNPLFSLLTPCFFSSFLSRLLFPQLHSTTFI